MRAESVGGTMRRGAMSFEAMQAGNQDSTMLSVLREKLLVLL